MQAVAEQTHYLPEQWRGQCASFGVRDEFLSMFKFKAALFAEEVLVVLSLPYLLMQSLPQAADAILAFIRDHTVDVEGIGSVCGFSLFDFERYGTTRSIRYIRLFQFPFSFFFGPARALLWFARTS